MLRHIHIQNLALIEDAALELGGGLTVVTGETGAGKTLMLEALGLLAGMRASPSLVRSGADRATVEALFDAPRGGPLATLLADHGLEPEEAGEVLLRREVLGSGRSRAAVNGRLVPASLLADIAANLIEISAQHEQQRLLLPAVQRDFHDAFARLEPRRAAVERDYHALRQAIDYLEELRAGDRDREQRRDFLRFQVEELEALALTEGELEAIEQECSRLGHLEDLVEQGGCAGAALAESSGGERCVEDLLGMAISSVESMIEHDGSLRSVLDSLLEAQEKVSDSSFELSRYLASLEADPDRLDAVNERAAAIRRALRKYGPTEADAIALQARLTAEAEELENWESSLAEAEKRVAERQATLRKSARELSAARRKAKKRLLRPLVALLADFAMPDVRLDMAFRPVSSGLPIDGTTLCGPAGAEEVELLFSANEGEAPQPLRRVASGGELSRLMLALRTLSAEWGDVPLLVFDEIDAGISGTAARCVAERLAALGARTQILAVTHNATVASAANDHLVVDKKSGRGKTTSTVSRAEGVRRQGELARLLDGGKRSEKGMALAAELLEKAG